MRYRCGRFRNASHALILSGSRLIVGPMTHVRDLEYSFNVRDRTYAVQGCGCGNHPASVSGGDQEVTVFAFVPDELLDHEDDNPYKIARDAIGHVRKFLPATISEADWEVFEYAIVEWLGKHRADPSLRDRAA